MGRTHEGVGEVVGRTAGVGRRGWEESGSDAEVGEDSSELGEVDEEFYRER